MLADAAQEQVTRVARGRWKGMTLTELTHMRTQPTLATTDTATLSTSGQPYPALVPPRRSLFDVLVRGKPNGVLLQDLATISTSIPWLRSQRYWANAAVEVFTSQEIPSGATSDGEQSRKAVEVYLASLRAAEQAGCREAMSYVLELGSGAGVFAKLFLDQLRARSKRDYERTTYIVADYSKRLLDDTRKTGVFAAHEDRVRRIHLPTQGWRDALAKELPEAMGAIRAIHGNYLLDSLPFTILSYFDGRLFELRLRTRLRKELLQPGMTPPATTDALEVECWLADVLQSVSESADTALEFEAEYVPVEPTSLPLPELLPEVAGITDSTSRSVQVLHGYGAIEFLEEALGALRSDGYFVVLDYDVGGLHEWPIEFETYGSSMAAGVNFDQLVAFARARPDCQVGVPPEDPSTLQARCFARGGVPAEVIQLFEATFSREAVDRRDAPFRAAKDHIKNERYDAARVKLEEAHRLQPYNWVVLEFVGVFLANRLLEHDSALEVTRRALQLNHLYPPLWNLLGDCHFNLGNVAEADKAYREAVRLSPRDPRGLANLAYVHLKRAEHADALRLLGQALALDRLGVYRQELLSKQSEALAGLLVAAKSDKHHAENRRIGLHALPCRTSGAANGVSTAPSNDGSAADAH